MQSACCSLFKSLLQTHINYIFTKPKAAPTNTIFLRQNTKICSSDTETHMWMHSVPKAKERKKGLFSLCAVVQWVTHTNVGLRLLANKLITVCDLCPLLSLTPSPTAVAATASRQAPSSWDSRGEGFSLHSRVVTQDFSLYRLYFHIPHFTKFSVTLLRGFMPSSYIVLMFSQFTLN